MHEGREAADKSVGSGIKMSFSSMPDNGVFPTGKIIRIMSGLWKLGFWHPIKSIAEATVQMVALTEKTEIECDKDKSNLKKAKNNDYLIRDRSEEKPKVPQYDSLTDIFFKRFTDKKALTVVLTSLTMLVYLQIFLSINMMLLILTSDVYNGSEESTFPSGQGETHLEAIDRGKLDGSESYRQSANQSSGQSLSGGNNNFNAGILASLILVFNRWWFSLLVVLIQMVVRCGCLYMLHRSLLRNDLRFVRFLMTYTHPYVLRTRIQRVVRSIFCVGKLCYRLKALISDGAPPSYCSLMGSSKSLESNPSSRHEHNLEAKSSREQYNEKERCSVTELLFCFILYSILMELTAISSFRRFFDLIGNMSSNKYIPGVEYMSSMSPLCKRHQSINGSSDGLEQISKTLGFNENIITTIFIMISLSGISGPPYNILRCCLFVSSISLIVQLPLLETMLAYWFQFVWTYPAHSSFLVSWISLLVLHIAVSLFTFQRSYLEDLRNRKYFPYLPVWFSGDGNHLVIKEELGIGKPSIDAGHIPVHIQRKSKKIRSMKRASTTPFSMPTSTKLLTLKNDIKRRYTMQSTPPKTTIHAITELIGESSITSDPIDIFGMRNLDVSEYGEKDDKLAPEDRAILDDLKILQDKLLRLQRWYRFNRDILDTVRFGINLIDRDNSFYNIDGKHLDNLCRHLKEGSKVSHCESSMSVKWRKGVYHTPVGSTERIGSFPITELLEIDKQKIGYWEFDAFYIGEKSNNHPLATVVLAISERYQMLTALNCNRERLTAFIGKIEEQYGDLPYHNSMHAADATNSMYYFFHASEWITLANPLEVAACILAAATHDVGHTGKTNGFLVNTRNPLAIRYNDQSVMESYHAALTFEILTIEGCNVTDSLSVPDWKIFRRIVTELILETDMNKHFESMAKFRAHFGHEIGWGDRSEDWQDDWDSRFLVMKFFMKCADLGHTAKCNRLHTMWTTKLFDEFFLQGDEENRLNLPLSPLCDRATVDVVKSQAGFLRALCIPMFSALCDVATSDRIRNEVLCQIQNNNEYWKLLGDSTRGESERETTRYLCTKSRMIPCSVESQKE